MKNNNLCVIYCRVSSGKQREKGLSLEIQHSMLEIYADRQNFIIVKKWIVVESGVKPGRKFFNEMINFVRENNIKNILVQEIDRLHRNKKDEATIDELVEENFVVHLVGDRKIIDQNGENDIFMRDIEGAVGRREIRQMQRRTSRAKIKRLENGEYVSQAPLGFLNIPKMRGYKERYRKIEDVASKVKKLLLRYNTGLYTLQEMLDYAKKIGLKSKQGNEIEVSAMRYILVNYFYAGMWKFTDRINEKVLFSGNSKGQWEKLVDKSVIDGNVKILEGMTGLSKKATGYDFRFKGLMVCGNCRRAVLGEKGGYPDRILKNGKKVSYDVNYYHCHKSPYKDKPSGEKVKCSMPFFPEDLVESEIIKHLDLLKFDIAQWEKIKRNLFNFEIKDDLKKEQMLLRTERTKLERRLDYLLDQKINNEIKEDYFNSKKSEWENRNFKIKDELEELDIHLKNWDSDVGRMIQVVDNLKDFKSKWIELTPKKRDSQKVQAEKKSNQRNMLRLITRRISTYAYLGSLTKQKFPGSKKPIVNKLHSRCLNFEWSEEFQILFENGVIKKFDNRGNVDKFQEINQQIQKSSVQADNKNCLQKNNSLTFYCQIVNYVYELQFGRKV